MDSNAPSFAGSPRAGSGTSWNYRDVYTFYDHLQATGGTAAAEQWGTLASCAQYRLPYQKTAEFLSSGNSVLDWGCGNGHFSYFLLSNGLPVEAFSFQEPPVFLGTRTDFHHTPGSPASPVQLPYPSGHFDVVFSIGVLEHVHESGGDQRASILEVQRVLKPGGKFLIFHLPNRFTWIEFFVRTLNRLTGPSRHAHTRLFTYSDVTALLKGTPFEIVESGRYNFIPRNSFNRLPRLIANSPRLCRWLDAVDDLLARVLAPLTQNWYFILRKRN